MTFYPEHYCGLRVLLLSRMRRFRRKMILFSKRAQKKMYCFNFMKGEKVFCIQNVFVCKYRLVLFQGGVGMLYMGFIFINRSVVNNTTSFKPRGIQLNMRGSFCIQVQMASPLILIKFKLWNPTSHCTTPNRLLVF